MASTPRQATADLAVAAEPERRKDALFELLRWLEHAHPEAAPIGGTGPVDEELVRFRGDASLAFPVRDIVDIEHQADSPSERIRITLAFMTLYGPDSPLPAHDTERILRADEGDTRARDFLDVFNHRILSLLYRTWARPRPYTAGSRLESTAAGRAVRALVDPSGSSAADRWFRPGDRFQGTRSAAGLARRLRALVPDVPIAIEQCVPQRIAVPRDQRLRLGIANTTLGIDTVAGSTIWEATGRFRVRIGPVSRAVFESLEPGTPTRTRLQRLIASWSPEPLDFTVDVRLEASLAEPMRLGGTGTGRRLGVDAWLASASATSAPASSTRGVP